MFSGHNVVKLEINIRKIWEISNMWKLNNTLVNQKII